MSIFFTQTPLGTADFNPSGLGSGCRPTTLPSEARGIFISTGARSAGDRDQNQTAVIALGEPFEYEPSAGKFGMRGGLPWHTGR